jgi:hypothetical protein
MTSWGVDRFLARILPLLVVRETLAADLKPAEGKRSAAGRQAGSGGGRKGRKLPEAGAFGGLGQALGLGTCAAA